MNLFSCAVLVVLTLATGACSTSAPSRSADAQTAFFQRVSALCGRAFEGRIAVDEPPPTGADPFTGKRLVMHVRECSDTQIRIPFHVGDDRSRTWVLTRTATGLRLKHDHRHEDGSADTLTMYGGDTRDFGTAGRQAFPVDEASQAMFTRAGRSASSTNVWAMEITPGSAFVYELARPQRLFRVEFDLSRPVETPPAPWGAQ